MEIRSTVQSAFAILCRRIVRGKYVRWWKNLEYRWCRVALIVNGLLLAVAYPNALYGNKAGWVWDVPGRNHAMENMIVAVYVTMGLFLIGSARNPVRALALIDFVIVSGFAHATVMLIDALRISGEAEHLLLGADVFGTYITPISLALFHPHRFYLWPTAKAAAK